MKTTNGIKETKTGYLVDLDEYFERERYYADTKCGVILIFSKVLHPDLFAPWNALYPTKLDVLLSRWTDGDEIEGVAIYRKGVLIK